MKRYSIAPTSARKSMIKPMDEETKAIKVELEKVEQETTLILQEIDKNISRGNSVINDRLIPIIKQYSQQSKKVWSNSGFWKSFFEQSANVELTTYEEPAMDNYPQLLLSEEDDEVPLMQIFKKPKEPVIEATPTWSQQKFQSSTPQFNKGQIIPPYQKYDSYDSIGMQPPPVLTEVHTMRQSLDNYHRLSLSPQKTKTKRSSLIENLLSSPTLPEPPVLRSEMSPDISLSEKVSPAKNSNTTTPQRLPNKFRLSEIENENDEIVPPVQTVEAEEEEEEDLQLPELNTIDLQRKRNNDTNDNEENNNNNNNKRSKNELTIQPAEEDNVFIDRTNYQDSQSTLSQAFDQIKNNQEKQVVNDLIQEGNNTTNNSTSNISITDMGSVLGAKFKSLIQKE